MNLTIKLPDEDVPALKAKATARGVSAEQYALQVLEDIMLKWRLLVEEGRKTGHTFSQPDIAATAIHHGLTVVTRNRSDYDKARVPVVNPWDAP